MKRLLILISTFCFLLSAFPATVARTERSTAGQIPFYSGVKTLVGTNAAGMRALLGISGMGTNSWDYQPSAAGLTNLASYTGWSFQPSMAALSNYSVWLFQPSTAALSNYNAWAFHPSSAGLSNVISGNSVLADTVLGTNGVTAGAGNANAPGFSMGNATGIYKPSTYTLAVTCGGTPSMLFYASSVSAEVPFYAPSVHINSVTDYLMNSNSVLFWVTATQTNVVSDGR